MVNVNKLKGAIVEHGMNIEILADKIGMDKSTFYRRVQANGDTFTLKEASDIVSALGLTAEEGTQIFFCQRNRINATFDKEAQHGRKQNSNI